MHNFSQQRLLKSIRKGSGRWPHKRNSKKQIFLRCSRGDSQIQKYLRVSRDWSRLLILLCLTKMLLESQNLDFRIADSASMALIVVHLTRIPNTIALKLSLSPTKQLTHSMTQKSPIRYQPSALSKMKTAAFPLPKLVHNNNPSKVCKEHNRNEWLLVSTTSIT